MLQKVLAHSLVSLLAVGLVLQPIPTYCQTVICGFKNRHLFKLSLVKKLSILLLSLFISRGIVIWGIICQ